MSLTISITSQTSYGLFCPGDTLEGSLTFDAPKEYAHNGVFLNISRSDSASWRQMCLVPTNVPAPGAPPSTAGVPDPVDPGRMESVLFAGDHSSSQTVQLQPKGVLSSGRHVVYFRLQLGDNLIPSTKSVGGEVKASVTYTLQGEIKRSMFKSNPRANIEFLVAARPGPTLFQPVSARDSKTFLMASGDLAMELHLPRAVAVATEILVPRVIVTNRSSKDVNSVTLKLVQVVEAHGSTATRLLNPPAGHSQSHTDRTVLSQIVLPGVRGGQTTDFGQLQIPMPQLLAVTAATDVLNIRHELIAECNVSMAIDLTVTAALYAFHAAVFYAKPMAPPFGDQISTGIFVSQYPAQETSTELMPPPGCHLLNGCTPEAPQRETIRYTAQRMYWVDVSAITGAGPRILVSVVGEGRSALAVHVSKDTQPGLMMSYQGKARDLGGCRYELILDENSTPPISTGRFFIGVWGQQLLPPKSTYTLTFVGENVTVLPWGDDKPADAAPAAAAAATGPSEPPPFYDGYAPPVYEDPSLVMHMTAQGTMGDEAAAGPAGDAPPPAFDAPPAYGAPAAGAGAPPPTYK